ncbi:MAG: amidohydrolase [Candidatus Bathyarchaeota archaeon]|nr:MAG: amidohydrolase [Candidatus Bathyarchaeota archaeon]
MSSNRDSWTRADLVLLNGKVVTADAKDTIAEAVAVKGSRIVAVSNNRLISEAIGEGTEVVDLEGRTVFPGLIDSHMHPGSYGVFWVRGVKCGPDVESMEKLLERVKEKADATPAGRWILGYALDDVKLGRYPSRRELDGVTPENPLYIQRRDGHIGVANSLALEAAGITVNTPDPPHGKIDRDEDGEPTGVLRESAKDLVSGMFPSYTVDEFVEGLKHVFDEFIGLGLTTIHASMTDSTEFKAMQRLRKDEELKLRVCVHASGREEGMLESLIAAGIQTPFGDDWLKLTEVEWVFDTSTSGRTAAYYDPYVGEPDNYGILLYDQEDITDRVTRAHRAGIRIGLDGIGDRGIDRALDAIEAALREQPREDHRHRIEHCCYVPPPIQRRLKELGVIDASANGFLHDLGDAYKANRGEEQMRWMWPHRTLIDQGIPAPAHSDCPVCSPNPWLGIYSLVTRKTSSGDTLYAGEGITPMEAIRAYTVDGAHAAWEEDLKGSIEPGKLADMVVLDGDPLTMPHEELKDVRTLMTVVDGRIVYRSDAWRSRAAQ